MKSDLAEGVIDLVHLVKEAEEVEVVEAVGHNTTQITTKQKQQQRRNLSARPSK